MGVHPQPIATRLTWTLPLVSALSQAERDLNRLAALAETFPLSRLLIQPFIRSEAVTSSRIEGTRASLVDLYTFEIVQPPFFAQVEDVRGGALTPGEFRRSQNWIGPAGGTPSAAPYVPPPVDEMHRALDALEKFLHAETQIPALARLGMIHSQFEAIHPFLDGNGRVGRLLVVLLLCEWGLLPQPLLNLSAYLENHRQEYTAALLAVSRQGAWEAWLRFFLRGVSEQARDGVARLERLQEMRTRQQSIVERERNPARMAALIDFIFTRPIISLRQASQEIGIPFKTVGAYVAKLERAGMLREITGQARNRIYRCDEILNGLQ